MKTIGQLIVELTKLVKDNSIPSDTPVSFIRFENGEYIDIQDMIIDYNIPEKKQDIYDIKIMMKVR